MINFITNLPLALRSGGFSAMNVAAFAALSKRHTLNYVGPINPPVIPFQHVMSKALRLVGSKGDFFFFSARRLAAIANEVAAKCPSGARLDFFHGLTPWILTHPSRPYMAWSDCTFRDYIDIYHHRESFRPNDISRIEECEARWLRRASRVLFTSRWAVERAITNYALDPGRVGSIGIFGEVDMPTKDTYTGGKEFAFVSTNFEAKGGRVVLAALREVRKRHPDAALTVVGALPSGGGTDPGVRFTGFLRKENDDEYAQFRQILARVRALIHPTKSDITPLLAVEAGYFGCPMISSRTFAIPEIIDHAHTGLLLDDSSEVGSVASAMIWMLEHEHEYDQMRKAAWTKCHTEHTKSQFERRLLSYVSPILEGTSAPGAMRSSIRSSQR